ncbi:MAG TPA: hypothetical protein VHM24_00565 [Gemmatimonadaceae bacterium]|nr:hypothetical protein [Gemmatimonadaceae bacterium]
MADGGNQDAPPLEETVSGVAQLYLGNILYALELAALALEDQQKPADAAFYRGIARKLAEARGKERPLQA